jgi:Flp pilus assembly protein TadG
MLIKPAVVGGCTDQRRRVRRQKRPGDAATEFAVLAPFLAFLFVVSVDFARVFYYQLTLETCVANGALLAANLRTYGEATWVIPDNTIAGATAADGSTLSPPLASNQVSVSYGTGTDGNPNVTVSVSYPFTTITKFPGFNTTLNLSASCTMRVAP